MAISEGLRRAARVATGGPHRDVVAGRRFAVDSSGHGHQAGVGVDRKPSTRVVVERVADRVGAVRIIGKRRHTRLLDPGAEFSRTKSAAASVSLTAVTPDSLTSVTLIEKISVANEPSVLVARIVML